MTGRITSIKRLVFLVLAFTLALTCSDNPQSVEELRAAGIKAYLDGEYRLSREYLRDALTEKPSDKELLYFTALAYRRDFIMDSAYFFVKRAELLFPDDRELVQELYDIASTLGEYDDARKALLSLIRLGDPLEEHIEELVNMLASSGSQINTFYYLHKWYLEFGLDNSGRFRQLASLAAKQDSFELAQAVLDSAVARWGMNDDFLVVQSEIYFNKNELTKSEEILRDLVDRHPESLEFKLNLASSLSNQRTEQGLVEALEIVRRIREQVADPVRLDSLVIKLESRLEELRNPTEETSDKQ